MMIFRRRSLPPKNRLFQLLTARVEYGVDKPGILSGYISALDWDETLKDGWVGGIDEESGCHQVCLFDCEDEPIPIVNNGFLPLTDPTCSCSLPADKSLQLISDFFVTVDKDELEVSNSCITIEYSDFNAVCLFGTCESVTTTRCDGTATLYFIGFEYAVDATLELWFTSADEEKKKVTGKIVAFYGGGFKYDCKLDEKDYYKAVLFEADKSCPYSLDTGKISLRRSRLIAPITCSLIVEADLRDCETGASILTGSYEFPANILNGSSRGRIEGTDGCSINLEAKWKYDDAY